LLAGGELFAAARRGEPTYDERVTEALKKIGIRREEFDLVKAEKIKINAR
jgi:hypothetical protein